MSPWMKLTVAAKERMEEFTKFLTAAQPRLVGQVSCRTFMILTDAAFEKDTRTGGLGGVLLTGSGSALSFFSVPISEQQADSLSVHEEQTIIYELEMFGVLVGILIDEVNFLEYVHGILPWPDGSEKADGHFPASRNKRSASVDDFGISALLVLLQLTVPHTALVALGTTLAADLQEVLQSSDQVSRQQDAAEFLTFLQSSARLRQFAGTWASLEANSLHDQGGVCPLFLSAAPKR
eukprot:s6763_g2.t1